MRKCRFYTNLPAGISSGVGEADIGGKSVRAGTGSVASSGVQTLVKAEASVPSGTNSGGSISPASQAVSSSAGSS